MQDTDPHTPTYYSPIGEGHLMCDVCLCICIYYICVRVCVCVCVSIVNLCMSIVYYLMLYCYFSAFFDVANCKAG